jgi:hypothetical protein
MKTLIIITTLLLLNCADNITNKSYTTENKTWCSVDKYNNGEYKRIYKIDAQIAENGNYGTFYSVVIDSVKGDSIFVNSTDGQKLILDKPYSSVDEILSLNSWYDMDMERYGYAELYAGGKDIVKCLE